MEVVEAVERAADVVFAGGAESVDVAGQRVEVHRRRCMHDPALHRAAAGPRYLAAATGTVVVEPGRAPRFFPRIHDRALRHRVRAAVWAEYDALMALQAERGYEIAGVVLCNLRTGAVRVKVCEPAPGDVTGDALSSAPFCNARRVCVNAEPEPGHAAVAEFHTHPTIPDHPEIDVSPPSASDLYQLVVAAGQGVHNRTLIVAPEGVYECSAAPRAYVRLRDDLRDFYERHRYAPARMRASLAECRQPLAAYIQRPSYLARLTDVPARVFNDLIRDARMPPKEKPLRFAQEIARRLDIDVEFTPGPHDDPLRGSRDDQRPRGRGGGSRGDDAPGPRTLPGLLRADRGVRGGKRERS
jgi:hypothetical protein